MTDYIQPAYAIMLITIPPALIGAKLAHNRGRNILAWAALSALFPIFLMVIYFEKPLKEVPGGFRRCATCGEFIKWKADVCRYCGQPKAPPADPAG